MSDQTRISALERRIAELESQLDTIKAQIGRMPSRAGGKIEGQLSFDGFVQFEEQETMLIPAAGKIRVVAIDSGGALALQAAFPDGHYVILAQ